MSTELEFKQWLQRPEKTFLESIEFANKAWLSADFTLSSKYEVIITWLTEKLNDQSIKLKEYPFNEIKQLFKLRAQPGLISQQIKSNFINSFLKLLENSKSGKKLQRTIPETLQSLIEFEPFQDVLRADYDMLAYIYAQLFQHYQKYLLSYINEHNKLLATHETNFFVAVLNSLKDNAKKASNTHRLDTSYCKYILQPLTEVILILENNSLCFFDELAILERQICEGYKEGFIIKRIFALPLHVRLLVIECVVVNFRNAEHFLKSVLMEIFKAEIVGIDPALTLTVAAYTLEVFRKHEVNLNLKVTEKETALVLLGKRIFSYVQEYRSQHLQETLLLLCAALRLNPLILEQHIFIITAWLVTADKVAGGDEERLFEEFLILTIDMFRRLSRAEKFVVNLTKALKQYLSEYQLSGITEGSKRKRKQSTATPAKKPKLDESTVENKLTDVNNYFLQILFSKFIKNNENTTNSTLTVTKLKNFPQLKSSWPSESAGLSFSRFITGLVSKPSLVIWKSLLYALKDVISNMNDMEELDENAIFELDFTAALLCQYFAGSKLTEQSDKFIKEIVSQREMTAEVLGTFGRFILSHVHNKRTINAFLECCYYNNYFELILVYYRPDGLEHETLKTTTFIHNFCGHLTSEEWTLIEQRVLNFGKSSCKFLLNRLNVQRMQAQILLQEQQSSAAKFSLQKSLLSTISNDSEQLELLLQTPQAKWIVSNLAREEKIEICKQVLIKPNLLEVFTDDLESIELIVLDLFEDLSNALIENNKDSLLVSIKCDYVELRANTVANFVDKHVKKIFKEINSCTDVSSIKALPHTEVDKILHYLQKLPISYLHRQTKNLLFALQLALYRDLIAAEADDLANKAFEIITDLLHFGPQVAILKHLSAETLLRLLPPSNCWQFYELLFATIEKDEKGSEIFLTSLYDILKTIEKEGKLKDDPLRLLLLAMSTLINIKGPTAKRMRKHLENFLEIYDALVKRHFSENEDTKNSKKFVEKTLAGFANYANSVLSKTANKTEETETTVEQNIDESFRRICKIYIGYSMDYRNSHAIRLVQVALNHRKQLHLDQEEIEFVLTNYWQQLHADLEMSPTLIPKTTETVIKTIIGNKTNEDFLFTLTDISSKVCETQNLDNILTLLTFIAKAPFSTIKGAIFNEQFKQISCDIISQLTKNEQQQFSNMEVVSKLLASQKAVTDNKMVPLSLDTLDNILSFLMNINIKNFQITDTNVDTFNNLHMSMLELCTSLIKHRHMLLLDRVPQFMYIFKDLVQSIVWYKSERQKNSTLSSEELDQLAELALKLEILMNIIATHGEHIKRVAPFVLTFVISLMVANKPATTLYPKIKTHIDKICFDLIGICDHRVGRFILRCSNEAARQVYEKLVTDHKKYHKFKGKV
ncbi:uncharacterized protein LOC119670139 [Teleopsis dalmanni]|uniref:uncharacterized protein LOC119670139 n=1 Tax=Teleopsis dalmanni TaxID=139649 RepID=UPI0018CEBB7B|nr:uncharacterized protein LOC119670139 [Teleopsis dalmanni]